MNWRSLEVRLLAYYCLLLLALGGGFALFTVQSYDRFERETILRVIRARAGEVWAVGSSSIDDAAQLSALLERRFSPSAQDRFIRISSNGRVYYSSGQPASREFDPASIPLARGATGERGREYGDLYLVAREFRHDDGRPFVVESGQSDRFAKGFSSNLVSSLLLGLPLLLAFAALGGYFLIRQALAPLGAMVRAAEAITFNDPHTRLPLAHTGDRLELLGQALNRMLDRLDAAYQHASRFSADAAHELRTPLAIIRGEIEFIAQQSDLSPAVRESIVSAAEEARRLADLTGNLLILSRIGSVWGKTEHAKVDLHALACETLEQMELLAEEKQIAMTPPKGATLEVLGDRNRLKQVLVNLIDNAIKYTPVGGHIRVTLETQEQRAVLRVIDSGVGIAPQNLDQIFERFFRVSTDRGVAGAGLGLAIARAICQAHGGTLTVRSIEGKGSEFVVEVPLAA